MVLKVRTPAYLPFRRTPVSLKRKILGTLTLISSYYEIGQFSKFQEPLTSQTCYEVVRKPIVKGIKIPIILIGH